MSATSDSIVSIVMPVHNQTDHIAAIVDAHQAKLSQLTAQVEFILVTNACTDDSPEVCNALSNTNEQVVHVNIAKSGWGRAVKAGLGAANGDVLCYTNSARTTPEILLLMLLFAQAYPEAVLKTNRRVRDSFQRRLGSLLYNLECRALFDLPTWDINGTPKVFPRSFTKLLDLRSDDDLIDAEFNWVCQLSSYPVLEIPILQTERHGGKSTTNLGSAFRMYLGAYKLRRKAIRRGQKCP